MPFLGDATDTNLPFIKRGLLPCWPKVKLPSFVDITQHRQLPFLMQKLTGDYLLATPGETATFICWGGKREYVVEIRRKLPLASEALTITIDKNDTDMSTLKADLDDKKFGVFTVEWRDQENRLTQQIVPVHPKIRNAQGAKIATRTLKLGESYPVTFYAGYEDADIGWSHTAGVIQVVGDGPEVEILAIGLGDRTLTASGLQSASDTCDFKVVA